MRHTLASGIGWPALAALGLVCLASCLEEAGDRTVETPALTGTIRNSCGPADGPAIGIQVDRGSPRGCQGGLDYLDTNRTMYAWQIQDLFMDSLKVGRSYADTQEVCDAGGCRGRMIFKFTADQIKGNEVRGDLQVRNQRDGFPEVRTETPVVLTVCPEMPRCG